MLQQTDRKFSRSFGACVFDPFGSLGGPLDLGAKKFFGTTILTVTNIFKFGNFMYSRLRDIDEKPSVTEKEKTKKREKERKDGRCYMSLFTS